MIVSQTRASTLRLAALLGFIAGMPVLAIPSVNHSLDEWLFPAAPAVDTLPARAGAAAADSTAVVRETASGSAKDTLAGLSAGSSTGTLDGAMATARLPPPDIPVNAHRFEAMQRRLQELGAVYFRLEDTGESPARYRFRCELPLPGNMTYLRPFEHEDGDPDRAMQAVLDDVELWLAAKRMRSSGSNRPNP